MKMMDEALQMEQMQLSSNLPGYEDHDGNKKEVSLERHAMTGKTEGIPGIGRVLKMYTKTCLQARSSSVSE